MITLFCIHPKGFNVGNDAIHFALRDIVHEAFGRVVNIISLPATSLYESQAKGGLSARTVHDINRFGDGVIIGGGNLYENGELQVNPGALEALEPPLMLFSLSRGRIYNRILDLVDRTDVMPRATIEALHRKAKYSVARDDMTLEYLHSVGCDHAVLGACPTIHLNRTEDQLPPLPAGEEAGVLVSIRVPSLMNVPLRIQAGVQDHIERIIDTLREQNVGRIRLLCHDIRDVEFATIFQATRRVDYVYTSDVRWYLALLRAAKLVVSYRLHATLPAISYGVPTVSISYDERATSLFRVLGLGEWDINMIETADVPAEVANRLRRLDDLAALRIRQRGWWKELRDIQVAQMTAFATDVKTYARSAHSKYAHISDTEWRPAAV